MNEYAFVLGSNWLLSIAELLVYVQDRGFKATLVDHSRHIAILDIKDKLDNEQVVEMQAALGGCYKVSRVLHRYDSDTVRNAFPTAGQPQREDREALIKFPWLSKVWQNPKGKKIRFGLSTYPEFDGKSPIQYRRFARTMDEKIKSTLIQKGARKADYFAYDKPDKRVAERMNLALWPKSIAQNNLLIPPNSEILAAFTHKHLYFARTLVVYDSALQQYRDESRPYISSKISTSPKICRTLLTLAGARPGDTILDPFCGTGTILMEAAMLGMKVIGIDIDGNQVQGTRSNLIWFGKDLGQQVDFEIIRGDARDLSNLVNRQVDAVAFEPSLGPIYSGKPEWEDAENNIRDLTELYREVLKHIGQILRPDGRVAMTIPVIVTKDGPISVDIREMIKGTGLGFFKLLPAGIIKSRSEGDKRFRINPGRDILPERKRGQVVQRALIALEK
ncbi:MAG: DNA methyltransferase [Candidatus Thorarchaeota archaeon]|nr:DNA methyltransferase [Candidatus Thorarchaeota archaeon]